MDGATGQFVLTAITTVGFPICVAIYELVKLNKTIADNTKVLTVIATKLGLNDEPK